MAQWYGNNAAGGQNSNPVVKVPPGQGGGMIRVVYDKFVTAAALGLGDVVNMCTPLPPGALVTEVVFNTSGMGGSGALNIGWGVNSGDADAANATGFWSALAAASALTTALSLTGNNAAAGLFKLFSSAPATNTQALAPSIQPQLVVSTAGSTAVVTYQLAVYFITY